MSVHISILVNRKLVFFFTFYKPVDDRIGSKRVPILQKQFFLFFAKKSLCWTALYVHVIQLFFLNVSPIPSAFILLP
jgi:hypothetical protein